MPEVFIANLSSIKVLSLYRQILAKSLLGNCPDSGISPKFDPVLAILPKICLENDTMSILTALWDKKYKKLKQKEKKYFKLHKHFYETVLQVWPFIEIYNIPDYIPGSEERAIVCSFDLRNV